MFNKKRLCCCDSVDDVGPFYVECFPVIPYDSSELPLSGTYSFWTRIEQFVADPDENGSIADSQVLFSTLNGTAKNTNKPAGNFTFADLKSGGTGGPVWTLVTSWFGQEAGTTGPGVRITRAGSDFSRCLSLGLRGWYMDSSSRVIRQNGFDALSENRLFHNFPIPNPTFGLDKFSVGSDFLFQSGFENFSQQFGDLTWKTNPQLVANYPEELRGGGGPFGSGTLFVDTTARFPSTVTIPVSGTAKFLALDRASFPFTIFDIDVDISGNVVFDKTISAAGLLRYQYNQSASSQSFGETTKEYTPGTGNTFPIRLTVTRVNLPSFVLPGNFGGFDDFIFCFTSNDITDNTNANRSACGNCDQQNGGFALDPDCSPGFFPGSTLEDFNSVILGSANFPPLSQRSLTEPTSPANIIGGGSQPLFAGLPDVDVLGARIIWGPATSSGTYTVSLSSAAGGNSWGASLPTSVCSPFGGPPSGPQLVDFHHGTFDIPFEPFPPGSTVDVTKAVNTSQAILLV